MMKEEGVDIVSDTSIMFTTPEWEITVNTHSILVENRMLPI